MSPDGKAIREISKMALAAAQRLSRTYLKNFQCGHCRKLSSLKSVRQSECTQDSGRQPAPANTGGEMKEGLTTIAKAVSPRVLLVDEAAQAGGPLRRDAKLLANYLADIFDRLANFAFNLTESFLHFAVRAVGIALRFKVAVIQ